MGRRSGVRGRASGRRSPSSAQRRRRYGGSHGDARQLSGDVPGSIFGTGRADNRHVVEQIGELVFDRAKRWVTLAGRPLRLTITEYRLLRAPSLDAGGVATYQTLMPRIWGEKGGGNMEALKRALTKLRRKLGDDARKPRTSSAGAASATACPRQQCVDAGQAHERSGPGPRVPAALPSADARRVRSSAVVALLELRHEAPGIRRGAAALRPPPETADAAELDMVDHRVPHGLQPVVIAGPAPLRPEVFRLAQRHVHRENRPRRSGRIG